MCALRSVLDITEVRITVGPPPILHNNIVNRVPQS
jgi:hypothetical protein